MIVFNATANTSTSGRTPYRVIREPDGYYQPSRAQNIIKVISGNGGKTIWEKSIVKAGCLSTDKIENHFVTKGYSNYKVRPFHLQYTLNFTGMGAYINYYLGSVTSDNLVYESIGFENYIIAPNAIVWSDWSTGFYIYDNISKTNTKMFIMSNNSSPIITSSLTLSDGSKVTCGLTDINNLWLNYTPNSSLTQSEAMTSVYRESDYLDISYDRDDYTNIWGSDIWADGSYNNGLVIGYSDNNTHYCGNPKYIQYITFRSIAQDSVMDFTNVNFVASDSLYAYFFLNNTNSYYLKMNNCVNNLQLRYANILCNNSSIYTSLGLNVSNLRKNNTLSLMWSSLHVPSDTLYFSYDYKDNLYRPISFSVCNLYSSDGGYARCNVSLYNCNNSTLSGFLSQTNYGNLVLKANNCYNLNLASFTYLSNSTNLISAFFDNCPEVSLASFAQQAYGLKTLYLSTRASDMGFAFYDCRNLKTTDVINTSIILNNGRRCDYMFYNCSNMGGISFTIWSSSRSNIECGHAFYNCSNFNSSVLIQNNSGLVYANANNMFYNCRNFKKIYGETANIFNHANNMFKNCYNMTFPYTGSTGVIGFRNSYRLNNALYHCWSLLANAKYFRYSQNRSSLYDYDISRILFGTANSDTGWSNDIYFNVKYGEESGTGVDGNYFVNIYVNNNYFYPAWANGTWHNFTYDCSGDRENSVRAGLELY